MFDARRGQIVNGNPVILPSFVIAEIKKQFPTEENVMLYAELWYCAYREHPDHVYYPVSITRGGRDHFVGKANADFKLIVPRAVFDQYMLGGKHKHDDFCEILDNFFNRM